jgi:serine protease Do
MTPEIAQSLGLPPSARGAAIADVAEGSPGARVGLLPGDVILDVDRRPVASADEALRMLADGRSAAHLMRVYGRSGVHFVTLGRTG